MVLILGLNYLVDKVSEVIINQKKAFSDLRNLLNLLPENSGSSISDYIYK